MAESLKEYKNQFLEYLEIERGRSIKTVENYDRYLSRFLAFSKITSTQPKEDWFFGTDGA